MLLALMGCSFHKHKPTVVAIRPAVTKPIITPDQSLAARVVRVNTIARFVLLYFPADKMPKVEQTLFTYRSGLKVAELKVTGPQSDNNIVADIVSGEPQVGDSVRAD